MVETLGYGPVSSRSTNRYETRELFLTDVMYDADEERLGQAITIFGRQLFPNVGESAKFEGLEPGSTIRFLNDDTLEVTKYFAVREVNRRANGELIDFTINEPVSFGVIPYRYVQLVRRWLPRALPLKDRFKLITSVQVIAFAFTGIDNGTALELDEPQNDYVGLEIKELPGRVRSTNDAMNSMLAVLPTKMATYNPEGWDNARDGMVYLPSTIGKTDYTEPLPVVSQLTPRLVNRKGEQIDAARWHFWLKITTLKV